MKLEEAKQLLADATEDEEPVIIPASLLKDLMLDAIPEAHQFRLEL